MTTIKPDSIYSGLVALAKLKETVKGTNKKRSDMMWFDITQKSIHLGSAEIMSYATLVKPVLECETATVDMSETKTWLTDEERRLDVFELYEQHYNSCPDGRETKMLSHFSAKHVDDLTDDEVITGMSRGEARVRLEAWLLCAGVDGTLEKFVTSQPNWRTGLKWWMRAGDSGPRSPVIWTTWWKTPGCRNLESVKVKDGGRTLRLEGKTVATIPEGVNGETERMIEQSARLYSLVRSMSEQLFKLGMKHNNHGAELLCAEADAVTEYIRLGKGNALLRN